MSILFWCHICNSVSELLVITKFDKWLVCLLHELGVLSDLWF